MMLTSYICFNSGLTGATWRHPYQIDQTMSLLTSTTLYYQYMYYTYIFEGQIDDHTLIKVDDHTSHKYVGEVISDG